MATAFDVANYFLSMADEEAGDTISNLKLQKLVYYAQGFSLAALGRPLFAERLCAWQHGPVVPELYFEFNKHGASSIPRPAEFNPEVFSKEERDLLDEVYAVYGQFSAWKLRNMTHDEPPWKQTHANGEISHERLREYFATQLQ